MKKYIFCFCLFCTFSIQLFSQNNAWRNKVAPEILAAFNRGEQADLLVAFEEQADLNRATTIHSKSAKAHYVFSRLQETSRRTQARAMEILQRHNAAGNTLFLVNALAISKADATLAQQLAALPEVRFVCYDPWVYFSGASETTVESVTERNSIEWGVDNVGAPAVWALGYDGQGITVGGADTGYEWGHPALKAHYRGWNPADSSAEHQYNWHDAIREYSPLNFDTLGNPGVNPCGFDSPQPCDDNRHGTHTMGTIAGDDGMGNQIGVAPGAKWIGCRNMERGFGKPSSYIECFQWFLAPTDLGGLNADPDKAPHVINNSWYCDYIEGCTDTTVNELIHDAVINLKKSGVMVVVSNGNFGKECATTSGAPAYFEESFSVGSIQITNEISNFSSRGPVIIDGSDRLKPNISAPGSDVRSSVPNGNYELLSGTSMAGPHVVGVVALILSARPDLAGEVDLLEDFIEQTAFPLYDTISCGTVSGSLIPNNTFGFGRIDALAAVRAALGYEISSTRNVWPVIATVAPNPVAAEALFTIENLSGKSTIELFSADGKLVFSQKWLATTHETVRIPMEKQPSGIYFWQIIAENGVASGKLLKE